MVTASITPAGCPRPGSLACALVFWAVLSTPISVAAALDVGTPAPLGQSAGNSESQENAAARQRKLVEIAQARKAAEIELERARARLLALCKEMKGDPADCMRQHPQSAAEGSWGSIIMRTIERNWIRFDDDTKGCKATMFLANTGEVLHVAFDPPCSNPLMEESIRRAIAKSSPLPLPEDPADFRSRIKASFVPKD